MVLPPTPEVDWSSIDPWEGVPGRNSGCLQDDAVQAANRLLTVLWENSEGIPLLVRFRLATAAKDLTHALDKLEAE